MGKRADCHECGVEVDTLTREETHLLDDLLSVREGTFRCADEDEYRVHRSLRAKGVLDDDGELTVYGRQLAHGACDSCGRPGDEPDCFCPSDADRDAANASDQRAYESRHGWGVR